MLVDQLNEFEGHLDAQIHSTYENDPHGVNHYIPVASSGYHEPFELHPSSAHYHYSQPQGQSQGQSSLYSIHRRCRIISRYTTPLRLSMVI